MIRWEGRSISHTITTPRDIIAYGGKKHGKGRAEGKDDGMDLIGVAQSNKMARCSRIHQVNRHRLLCIACTTDKKSSKRFSLQRPSCKGQSG